MLMMSKHPESDVGRNSRPNRQGRNFNFWLDSETTEAFDAYTSAQDTPPSITAVMKNALREFFKRRGFLKETDPSKKPSEPDSAVTVPKQKAATFQINAVLPIYGAVAAGPPLETQQQPDEWFDFSTKFVRDGHFMLKVKGSSMIDEGVLPGDLITVRGTPEAQPGDDVVAMIGGSMTLKRLAKKSGELVLVSRNKDAKTTVPLNTDAGDRILGVLVGLVRVK